MPYNLNKLAALYDEQGRYGEAEPLLKQALEFTVKYRGEEHQAVLDVQISLAENYLKQGSFAQAEPLFKRVLTIVRKKEYNPGGPWHIYQGTDAMGGLALTYIGQERYELAEPLLNEAQVLLDRHISKPQNLHS